ncbi:MAG: putative cytokinetic ring protein SteA, partial [Armatimonadota bacterium]
MASSPARASRSRGSRAAGPARCGRRTKDLAKRLKRGDIAIIDHKDLDSVAAQMLVEAGVSGVVTMAPSVSARDPSRGADVLV